MMFFIVRSDITDVRNTADEQSFRIWAVVFWGFVGLFGPESEVIGDGFEGVLLPESPYLDFTEIRLVLLEGLETDGPVNITVSSQVFLHPATVSSFMLSLFNHEL
jgi:hypothetical protein